jgi:hypothetical protein
VIDVSDPARPTRSGSYDSDDAALGVSLTDRSAFVASGRSGMQVIDIRDPAAPNRSGSKTPSKPAARPAPWKPAR